MAGHVFFDFFGTLVDYDPSTHPSYNAPLAFARRAGVTISETASDAHWHDAWEHLETQAAGTGREYSMHQVAQRYWRSIGAPTLANGAIEILIGEYLDTWTESVSPAQHALECVTDLASDHRLTVVSNTHDPALVPRLVRAFGLDTTIDRVISSVTVGWRKPHPNIFATALRECGAAAQDSVFVGDNWDADVVGPRGVGMPSIYVGPSTALRPSTSLAAVPQIVRSLTGGGDT
ncbi:HAD family hydrolase [Mycobacterium sp. AZCC_0083]|uniref:HAD family hydrolase n=1 Tax=Mycobacterium sp. AZCC_0083 TaxID=2735882 RepID=UPI00160C51EB|nr:HAD family hydrolase [Mycobacterium sp. AZCC_0083]